MPFGVPRDEKRPSTTAAVPHAPDPPLPGTGGSGGFGVPRDSGTGVVEDMIKMAPGAARRGTEMFFGGPGSMSRLGPRFIRWAIEKLGADPETLQEFDDAYSKNTPAKYIPTTETVQEKVTDPLLGSGKEGYRAQTSPGKFAQTAIENAPSAVASPGGPISRIASWLASSVGEEGLGQLAHEYWPSAEPYARMFGGFVGGAGGGPAYNKLASPRPIPKERQISINTLEEEGVPVTAGQKTGDPKLQMKEDVAGGVPAAASQSSMFTQAAAARQGGFPAQSTLKRAAMDSELKRMGG
jgi:hypothetical protein